MRKGHNYFVKVAFLSDGLRHIPTFNSLSADNRCNSLDPDQVQQDVGPDLDAAV